MVQPVQPGEPPTSVQCETNPTGVDGVVDYDDRTYPITSLSSGERRDQEENLVVRPRGPLIREAPVPRASEDAGGRRRRRRRRRKQLKPKDQPSSVDNSTGEGGGLEHQPSSGERDDQEENLVVQPPGPLIAEAPDPSVNRASEDAGGQQPCQRHSYWHRAAVALWHWVVQPLASWANESLVPLGFEALGRWVIQVMGPWAAEALGPWAAQPAEALGRLATETLRRLVTLALRHLGAETESGVRNHDDHGSL